MGAATRDFVRRRAGNHCEYCLLAQEHSSLTHHIEHIVARQHGGSDDADNLLKVLCLEPLNLTVTRAARSLGVREDRSDDDGEQRWHAFGLAGGLEPLLVVVHVYRKATDGEEIIRIISARKASTRESRAYFQ